MPNQRYKPEQIVNLLRKIEVEDCQREDERRKRREKWGSRNRRTTAGGRIRRGWKLDQAKRLKELEKENSRLKRLVAELSLEKQVAARCGAGKLLSPGAAAFVAWSMHPSNTDGASRMPAGCWARAEAPHGMLRFLRS